MPLAGSLNSLRVHGIKGFQYPELAFLAFLPLVVGLFNFLTKTVEIQEIPIRIGRGSDENRASVWLSSERFFTNLCTRLFFYLKILIILLPLIILPFLLTVTWQIVSLGIFASQRNFPVSAQFITNCTAIPIVSQSTIAQCFPQEQGFSCYLGSKNS